MFCIGSTNEELQATLQELGDLQRNVNQLAEENEQLGAERMVLLESLCTQTDKLENARTQIEHLKALILSDTDHTQTEREQELVNLLKVLLCPATVIYYCVIISNKVPGSAKTNLGLLCQLTVIEM